MAEEGRCFDRPAFLFLSTLKQANARATALSGPSLASGGAPAPGAGLEKGPLGPGSWESSVICSPDAEEQAYYRVRLLGAAL